MGLLQLLLVKLTDLITGRLLQWEQALRLIYLFISGHQISSLGKEIVFNNEQTMSS